MNLLNTISRKFHFTLILSIIFLFGIDAVQAQITVTQEDLLQSYESDLFVTQELSENDDMVAPLIAQSGADQTWDFSEIEFDGLIEAAVNFSPNTGDAPGGDNPHFEQADFVLAFDIERFETGEDLPDGFEFETFYSYVGINEATGEGTTYGEIQTLEDSDEVFSSIYRPYIVDFVFPLTYEESWEFEYEEETTAEGFTGSEEYAVSVEVDGWGEVVTPAATIEVLRKRIVQTSVETGEEVEVSYEFIDENGRVVAVIDVDNTAEEIRANILSYEIATSSEPVDELSSSFQLNQNYPNPFNPSTTISFELPVSSDVMLEVFDVTGRRVAELVDGHRNAGTHEITFQADNLSSGVYTYRLTADGVSMSRTLTLIK